jgi:hypothetical protein
METLDDKVSLFTVAGGKSERVKRRKSKMSGEGGEEERGGETQLDRGEARNVGARENERLEAREEMRRRRIFVLARTSADPTWSAAAAAAGGTRAQPGAAAGRRCVSATARAPVSAAPEAGAAAAQASSRGSSEPATRPVPARQAAKRQNVGWRCDELGRWDEQAQLAQLRQRGQRAVHVGCDTGVKNRLHGQHGPESRRTGR